jgi:hypothetical protein
MHQICSQAEARFCLESWQIFLLMTTPRWVAIQKDFLPSKLQQGTLATKTNLNCCAHYHSKAE